MAYKKFNNKVQKVLKAFADSTGVLSPAQVLAKAAPEERQAWLETLTPEEQTALQYDWKFWGRPKQHPPKGQWNQWIICAGRGFGKTRSGAEWVRSKIESGNFKHIALIADNAKDLRNVMVGDQAGQGDSGIMQVCPPWNMPHYSPAKMRITWENPNYPSYGASCSLFSAEKPHALRGPQFDAAWIDEICKFKYADDVWDMLQFGLRLGENPQTMITTTPRNIPLFLRLLADPKTTVVTGSTFENAANLAEKFIENVLEQYEGTRLGRQELYAEVLSDVVGALWTQSLIERATLKGSEAIDIHKMRTRVVGVDPQMSFVAGSMTGIVVCGVTAGFSHRPPVGYVIEDCSYSGSPKAWASAVVSAFHEYDCHYVIAERNQGGELVADNIHTIDPAVPIKLVTATKSKGERAIPVVSRYEQNRVFHLGNFPEMVFEMKSYVPGDEHANKKRSPNRMDALVHALDFLMVSGQRAGAGFAIKRRI